ncbi:MAG: PDZ domain-containing protein [Planctomycetales bacterium]|nr:PDZ domain-containing protein [Planctomycetales bacterium]
MQKTIKNKLLLTLLGLAGVFGSVAKISAQEADADPPEKQKRRVVVIEDDADLNAGAPQRGRVIVRPRNLPKYWIGVACSMTDDGVVIGEVLPDSPAQKAGIKSGDVVVTAGGKDVAELGDLVEAVQTDGKPLKLTLERSDEVLELEVTPTERPADFDRSQGGIHLREDWDDLIPHLRGLMEGNVEDFDFSMIQPGVILDPADIPNGVSISITREGDGPAKLSIKRGDDSWVVTEDSIDKLPEDLQKTARRMLAAMGGKPGRRGIIRDRRQLIPRGLRMPQFDAIPDIQRPAEREDELRAELQKMREEMRELRDLIKELKADQ